MTRVFTSRQRAGDAEPDREWSFTLDGQRFTCVLRTDADAVLEWSEMAAAADDTELNTAAGAAFSARFFRLMMPPGEYASFRAHLRQHKTEPETLTEIMQSLNEAMEDAVARNTDRPTRQPSRSSAGHTERDERTLQIISLPDGEVEWADAPQSRQQRRSQSRRKGSQRRRTG